jgi:hypothetical protein
MKKIIIILTGVMSLASCSIQREIKKDTKAHDPEISAPTFGMVIKPIAADLKIESVKQSVTYTADLKLPLSELKNNAMELFLTTHKCDYVVDPIFSKVSTVENSQLTEIKITISGFPATYTKFYQLDSLPKSVLQYTALPVKRVEYTNSIVSEVKGTSFGMEFFGGLPAIFFGAQVDYAKNIDGMHYYAAFENYAEAEKLSFDCVVGKLPSKNFKELEFTQSTFSIGVFKEKTFSPRFKIRGSGGLNYSNMTFLKTAKQDTLGIKTSFTGASSIGLRVGAAADYKLFGGMSLVGRVHANLNLLNSIAQDGVIGEVSNITFVDNRLLNISLGMRFNF